MTRRLTVAGYVILGSLLAWSRLAGLKGGYCCDEIRTVTDYVREGPGVILTGPYAPNNHELFSLLGWATSSAAGESAIALRLWSAIPFLIGVAVVTVWLHARVNALSGLLFLFLATVSPLLLDITRLARGYGLAFCAMSVAIVAALELERSRGRFALVAFVTAGLVGSFTLPHFAIAFVATGLALLARRDLRVRVAIGTSVVVVATLGWYAPHLDDFADSRLADYGQQLDTSWIVTAPIDQTLVPAVTLLDDSFARPSLASLVLTIAFAVVIASSPLLRHVRTALILCSGVVASVLAFWVTGTFVVPRFLSFLLVPLFILVATGAASILSTLATRPARLRALVVVGLLAAIAVLSAPLLADVPRLPRDATSEAAAAIREQVPPSTPVYAHVAYDHDLAFHLGRPVMRAWTAEQAREVCSARRLAVYVDQPYLVPDAVVPCTRRDATRHLRFDQYARGHRIDVWVIPASS